MVVRRIRRSLTARRRAGAALVVGATTVMLLTSIAAYATMPPTDPPPVEPTTSVAATEPVDTGPPPTEPPSTDPVDTTEPATSEPGATTEPTDTTGSVESTAPPESSEPGAVALIATMRLFPDTNGDFAQDDNDGAVIAEQATVTAVVDVTNASAGATADITIVLPGSAPSEFNGVDVGAIRVSGPAASAIASYGDGTSLDQLVAAGVVTSVGRPATRLETLSVTFPAVAPGSTVRLEVQGGLNDAVDADDLPSGPDPGVSLCVDAVGSDGLTEASGGACASMAVQEPEEPDFGILALTVQPTFTLAGANPSWTGTMTLPAAGFPAATFATNSNTPTIPSGATAFLNPNTPFGAAFATSTQNQPYLNLQLAAGSQPSTTTFQFASPTPIGWGFNLGDVDAEFITITAIGPGGPLTAAQLGFQGSFNYCVPSPTPGACSGGPSPDIDVPDWDPATSRLNGNLPLGTDTQGASGWFRPTVPITSLTFTSNLIAGVPAYQLWFAAPSSNISGTVTDVTGGGSVPAPPGTVVELRTPSGALVLSTPINADGTYQFVNAAAGPYNVTVVPPAGFQVVGPAQLAADSTAGDVIGVNFAIQLIPPPTTATTTTSTTTTSTSTTTTTSTSTSTTIAPQATTAPPTSAASTTSTTAPPTTTAVDPCFDEPPPPPPGTDIRLPSEAGCLRALAPPAPNPPLLAACGITVMLVVDRSGSIQSAGATPAVKSALTTFVNTLNNTGSTVGLVDFSDLGQLRLSYRPLNDSTRGAFDSYITSYAPNGRTNWDNGLYDAQTTAGGPPDLTLVITDGEPNQSGGDVHPSTTNSSRVLEYAVVHANEIKLGGSRMFVVGVGNAASRTTELSAISGSSQGTDIQTNDFSTVPDFNDLAESLEDLVFGLCASSMTVSKLVDGVLAPGWDVTATITGVTPGQAFEWKNPQEAVTEPSSRTLPTGAAGTATFEWLIGSAADPLPGSVEMTLNEVVKPGFRFVSGNCTIDSASGTDRTVNFTSLPANVGTIPFDAIVKCALNNQTIPVAVPVPPTVVQAECVDGALTPPTLTLPTPTPGITYSRSPGPPDVPGGSVVVTATLASGYRWPTPMPPGWTRTSDTTATSTVTFANVSCAPATPLNPQVVNATCTNGEVTAPTITPQPTTGVSYVFSPAGPYDGEVENVVTVTATLADGFAWVNPMPAAWTRVDSVTARSTVTLPAETCDIVTPAAPEVGQAECIGGNVTEPTLTLPTTDGVRYAASPEPPYAPGQTVVVTASLEADGEAWPDQLPDGWTETSPTTAEFEVVFADVRCAPATPFDPAVVQATCANGVVTAPTITPQPTTGITYVLTPPGAFDGTVNTIVTVTATLSNGFSWADPLPDGWTEVDPVTATFRVVLIGVTCRTVSPDSPTVNQAECVGGVVTEPTLLLTPEPGIAYTTDALPPYAAGQTVVLTATLNPTAVAWPETLPLGWTKTSDTTATYTVTFADVSCTPATPLDPAVVQATCTNGAVTVPTVTPQDATGVSYVVTPAGPYDGTADITVTVTATLADGYAWIEPLPAGWTQVDLTTATFTVELVGATCDAVTPTAPGIDEAECVDGALTEPTLTLPTTDGITYSTNVAPPYSPGQTVVVTATLAAAGVAWPDPLPSGWTETTPTTATYTVLLADVSCAAASPVDPAVVQAACVNGVVTAPTVTPQPGEGIAYVVDPAGPYDGNVDTTVVVAAILADGFAWADPLPDGWTQADLMTATFTVELEAAACDEVTPEAPGLDEAECVDGALTAPALTLPDTDGITYTTDSESPYTPGQTVVVTATLDPAGVGWPDQLPDGWTRTSATTATYTVTFADVSCTPATPLNPTVVQATCADGEVTEATVTPQDTDGIGYTLDPAGPYDGTEDVTVTVTATLDAGYAWTDPLPNGWTDVDLVTATFTVELIGSTCATVTPVAPAIDEAVCVDGALTEPTLTLPETDEITYTTDVPPPYAPAQTVVVTATLDPAGVGWPDNLPSGWTETSATTATFTVRFADVACAPATPLDPAVAQATCATGVVTAPTVTPVPTDGISYTVDPEQPYDGTVDTTVAVTATLADGSAWVDPLPAGWTPVDLVTASFTVELIGATCVEVTPVEPANDDAVCVDGVLTPPTLTFPTTDGITYTVSADPPYAPLQTVTVTATLDAEGVTWPEQLPDGWVQTSATTATWDNTFVDVECTTVLPAAPAVAAASCGPGGVVPPTVTLAATPGIVYTAVPPGPYDGLVETEVVVTATLADGYAWGDSGAAGPAGFAGPVSWRMRSLPGAGFVMVLPTGWVQTSPTTATFTLVLPATPECPSGSTPTTSLPSGGPLPSTGADGVGNSAAAGAVLLLAGAALVLIARRRIA